MKTQTANSAPLVRLHIFVFSVACLWTMLTLDVVYASLLVHSYLARQLAARRERRAERRLKRAITAAVAYAAKPAGASASNHAPAMDTDMDSDMQRAA
jgi:hypothetical protein